MNIQSKWEEAVKFHGHTCPGLALGVRASMIALEKLAVDRAQDEELVAVVETDACGVDGVQVITGCTLGKGNLIFKDHGKQVYTIARRNDNKGVRVAFYHTGSTEEQQKIRAKVFGGTASSSEKELFQARQQQRIRDILSLPEEEVCKVAVVDVKLPAKASIFNSIRCAECGEYFMEPRGRLQGGKIVCLACFKEYSR
ncbi:MAG: FmdE family protein [Peptococcaceae bacterium]